MKIAVVPGMSFWWAIQSDNFPEVFPDGTLWAPLRGSSGQRVASWETLDSVRPGDLVLHSPVPRSAASAGRPRCQRRHIHRHAATKSLRTRRGHWSSRTLLMKFTSRGKTSPTFCLRDEAPLLQPGR
jgi:hypothetical protein